MRNLFADTSVRIRVAAAGLIPVVAFLCLAVADIRQAMQHRDEATRISKVRDVMPLVSRLVDALQRERGLSVLVMSVETVTTRGLLAAQLVEADRALDHLKTRIDELRTSDVGADALATLSKSLAVGAALADARRAVDHRQLTPPQVLASFNTMIGSLSSVMNGAVGSLSGANTMHHLLALIALIEAKDRAGLERAVGGLGFATPLFPVDAYQEFQRYRGEQEAYLKVAAELAGHDVRRSLLRIAESDETKRVEQYRKLAQQGLGSPQGGEVPAVQWFEVASARIALLTIAELRLEDALVADAREIVAAATTSMNTLLIAVLALLALVTAALIGVSRSITRPIVKLVADAIRLAGGDTSVKFGSIGRNDEIGMVARAIARFRDNVELQEKLKSEFIATVSHELRTPVTAIVGAIGLLAGGAGGHLPAPVSRLLAVANANCKRLVLLVNDILDVEKIESGGMSYDVKPTEIRELVEQAIEEARGIAIESGVTVKLEEDSACGMVMADSDRLIQVFTNLISNAVKFSAPGSEVAVMIIEHQGSIEISVRDHGPGIPEAYKYMIFEKFVQVDASDRRTKGGAGLGLSIARQITVALGGKIHFEAAPGGGTRFLVALPKLPQGARGAPAMPALDSRVA
ncbi:hypothetical protein BH11PSE4_BH11PSE4_37690 [soil metagenome]